MALRVNARAVLYLSDDRRNNADSILDFNKHLNLQPSKAKIFSVVELLGMRYST